MSGELNLHTTSGLTVTALILGQNRATRWNGSALVAWDAIADADWATGMVTMTEEVTSDASGTGTYVGDFPAGITDAGEYPVEMYSGAAPTPGQRAIGIQTVPWDGTAAAMASTHDAAAVKAAIEAGGSSIALIKAVTDALTAAAAAKLALAG